MEEVKMMETAEVEEENEEKEGSGKTEYFPEGKELELASLGSNLWSCLWMPEENYSPSLPVTGMLLHGA